MWRWSGANTASYRLSRRPGHGQDDANEAKALSRVTLGVSPGGVDARLPFEAAERIPDVALSDVDICQQVVLIAVTPPSTEVQRWPACARTGMLGAMARSDGYTVYVIPGSHACRS